MALTEQQIEARRRMVGVNGLGLVPPYAAQAAAVPAAEPRALAPRLNLEAGVGLPAGMLPDPANLPAAVQRPAPVAAAVPAPVVAPVVTNGPGFTGRGLTPPSQLPPPAAPAPRPLGARLGTEATGLGMPDVTSMTVSTPRPAPAVAAAAPEPAPVMYARPQPGAAVGTAPAPTVYPRPSPTEPPAVAAAPVQALDRAAFGVYPQLADSQGTTYATTAKLRQGVQRNPATGLAEPAMGLGAPLRMNAATDPRSLTYGAAPAAAAVAAPIAAPIAAAAAPATVDTLTPKTVPNPMVAPPATTVPAPVASPTVPAGATAPAAPAILAPQGAEGTQPTSVSEGPMSPPVAGAGRVTRVGNSFSGTNVGLGAPGLGTSTGAPSAGANTAAENLAAINRDIAYQQSLATRPDLNAPTPSVGGATLMGYDPEDPAGTLKASREFGDRAALNNALNRTTWSPRGGYRVDEAGVAAATKNLDRSAREREVAAQARSALATTALRDAGETGRLGIREAGDTARNNVNAATASQRTAIDSQRLALEGLGATEKVAALRMDNATRARVAALQTQYAAATTPEDQRRIADQLRVLTGKDKEDAFKAIQIGGGSAVIDGIAVPQPASALLYNGATGVTQTIGGNGLGAAAPGVKQYPGYTYQGQGKDGKPIYTDAKGKRVTPV
jgi:hypothetical protein